MQRDDCRGSSLDAHPHDACAAKWPAHLLIAGLCLVLLGFVRPASGATAYGLTASSQIIVFDTTTPGAVAGTLTITGLQTGESIVAIDIRPATGELYGLGSTSRLYRIDVTTGAATLVGTGAFSIPLTGTAFGFDFNPVPDRIRVTSNAEQNFRLHPDTAAAITPVDTALNPPGNVVGSAYTNNFAGASVTTLYGIDSAADVLVRQGDLNGTPLSPNTGVLAVIGPLTVDTSDSVGFDIAGNTAFASLTVGGLSRLYTIDLATGAATVRGLIGGGQTITGLAIDVPIAVTLFGVTAGNTLVTFSSAAPGTFLTSILITGLQTGESVAGIDVRPATGELYALGSSSRLYRLDPVTAVATPIGPTFATALAGMQFGVDFNPVVDRFRVVSDSEQNLRIHPDTGVVAGVDSPLVPPGDVTAVAYTNNITGLPSTTLYGLDSAIDQLVRIGGVGGAPSPNLGAVTVVGALGVDAASINGFDIAGIDNTAYAAITVGATPQLHIVDLATGAATLVGTIGPGTDAIRGLTAATQGRVRFGRAEYFTAENAGTVTITVERTGSTAGIARIAFATGGGTATAGTDYTADSGVLTFAPGVTTESFTVTVTDDAVDEADETITVSLSDLSPGLSLTQPSTATVTILDNDGPNMSPTVVITSPTSVDALASENTFITLGGVAADDGVVSSVTWSTDRGASGLAIGTTSWTAANIPLSVGANVITVRATDAAGQSGIDTITVTVSVLTYTLAEGATGSFFNLDFLLANPNNVPVPVTLTYLDDRGMTQSEMRMLPATSRTTIEVDTIAGLAAANLSTTVTSTTGRPLIVERTMRWDDTGYGSHTEKAVGGPATTWYFAEGSQGFFQTFLLLANPGVLANQATVQFLRENVPPVSRTYDLAPTSRTTIYAGAIDEVVNSSFGLIVTFVAPGVAERAMYFGEPAFNGGHESAGVNAPSTTWFLAEGATGTFFTTFVLLANPGDSDATVTLTYLPASGMPVTVTKLLPARRRLTINIRLEDPSLADAAVATRVDSTVPILVERAQYWPFTPALWYEAHNSFGVTATGLRWGLAEGRVGGTEAYQTFILLANPGSTAANVSVQFLRTTGQTLTKTFVVPPNRRFNVLTGPGTAVPELQNEHFGAIIVSDVPIAVERAMYSNANGVVWAAGNNATATRLP